MGNDNGEHIGKICNDILSALSQRRERLLEDMRPSFPAIRHHLLGREIAGRHYPAGRITIESDATECIVRLEIPMLDLIAEYSGMSSVDLLERVENDLDLETVPWRQGWKTRKRLREQAERALRGS